MVIGARRFGRPVERRTTSSLPLAALADTIWSVAGVIGGAAGIGLLFWAARSGAVERDAEDAAREFYTEHGRWPDDPG